MPKKRKTYSVQSSYEYVERKRAKSAQSIIDRLQKDPNCVAALAVSADRKDKSNFFNHR